MVGLQVQRVSFPSIREDRIGWVGKLAQKERGDIVFQLHIYRVTNRRLVLWYHGTTGSADWFASLATATGGNREAGTAVSPSFSLFLPFAASFHFPLVFSLKRNICGNTISDSMIFLGGGGPVGSTSPWPYNPTMLSTSLPYFTINLAIFKLISYTFFSYPFLRISNYFSRI